MTAREQKRDDFTYTDGDAYNLLDALAKYAEAFAADHGDADVTVKQLADHLAETSAARDQVSLERLRNRVYDGLNNNVGGGD